MSFVLVGCLLLAIPKLPAGAQSMGRIQGSVLESGSDRPMPGVHVFLDDAPIGTVTGDDGRFELNRVPLGPQVLVARFVGFETERVEIEVRETGTPAVEIRLTPGTAPLDELVVTAIGERQLRAEVTATVHAIGTDVINRSMPSHPSEVMGRLPGVWINTTSGEGHMTAIRQPLTTEPVYLFLENGVPTRSTGFFNHNALYETNVPMSEAIEVLKGPGTALYGSDAIGGVINVRTGRPYETPTAEVSAESGSFGFGRLMLSTGTALGIHALRLDVNANRSGGWRDASQYDRQTAGLVADTRLGEQLSLRTVASMSLIDQQPAGSSVLREEDFREAPETNYTPVSYRDVKAFRVSTAFERSDRSSRVSLTPYFRFNEMDILPDWSLSYDPTVYRTHNHSVGLLARYRRDIDAVDLRIVGGTDLEWSPGAREEQIILPEQTDGIFTAYSEGDLAYQYDVRFRQVAPYVHAEYKPLSNLQLTAGLRADLLAYAYENHLGIASEGPHRRAPSTARTFAHVSPKLGASYRIGASSVFASYRHAFRVPSEGQLFRQGSTSNTLELEAVKADNYEIGVRVYPGQNLSLEISAYILEKSDDIVDYIDATGARISTNAGATSHRGLEGAVQFEPFDGLTLAASHSYAVHRFDAWRPSTTLDLSGNEMPAGPRSISYAGISYTPSYLSSLDLGVDLNRLGSYWMDPENTVKYDGHMLLNLRANLQLPAGFEVLARITNAADERYAERASYHSVRGQEFAPGRPRAFFFGVRYHVSAEDGR